MKLKFFTLMSVAATLLAGCGNANKNGDGKVVIPFGDMNLTTYITVTKSIDIETMMDRGDNFILVSYALPTCGCWGTFSDSVLTPYVQETHMPIYAIYTGDIGDDDYFGLPIDSQKSNTPVIGIYENGKYKVGANYAKNELIFKKIDDFKNFMNRYVTQPFGYYVNFTRLNTFLKGDDKFLLYWSWKLCPDCTIFDRKFLKNYLKNASQTRSVPLYVIETHELRQTQEWQDIKDKYAISDTLNKTSGYGKGYVPAIQVIEPDGTDYVSAGNITPIVKDMFVYRNEFFTKNEDGSYTITDSYFNGVRGTKYLGEYESEIGKTFTLSEGQTKAAEARDPLHDTFAKKFLDYYWK